ncbi:MAG: hypothetical protein MJ085_02525 [Clostridia bacterium]|nr:hypothetical protein [Clostridia bacterium]
MRLFNKQLVNTGRQVEADFAKMICIIGMVFVHAFEEVGGFFPGPGEESSLAYIFVVVLDAIFGAATFMFCMGFGIAYSPNSDADALIKRGGKLLLFGYLLNFARDCIPYLLNYIITRDTYLISDALMMQLCNDILQFAGLALLLFGLLKKWRVSDLGLVIVALAMSAFGSFFRNFDIPELLNIRNGNLRTVANQLGGLIFGTVYSEDLTLEASCFPLLHWFIFVVAGYLFAKAMMRCSNKGRFYGIVAPCGAGLVTVYMLLAIPNKLGMMSEDLNMYYHLTTPEALLCIVATLTVFGMYYGLSRLLPDAVSRFAIRISKNLTKIYIIHWILIGFSLAAIITAIQLRGIAQDNWPQATTLQTVMFGIGILLTATLLAEIIQRVQQKREEKQ